MCVFSESYVYWTVHRLTSWINRTNLMSLYESFLLLNMFRMLSHSSSGAGDCMWVFCCVWVCTGVLVRFGWSRVVSEWRLQHSEDECNNIRNMLSSEKLSEIDISLIQFIQIYVLSVCVFLCWYIHTYCLPGLVSMSFFLHAVMLLCHLSCRHYSVSHQMVTTHCSATA